MARKKATSKRSNNEGSVSQNKCGLWVAQGTIGYDENGKQIRKAVSGKTTTTCRKIFLRIYYRIFSAVCSTTAMRSIL